MKVKEIQNLGKVTLPVELANGITVYVPPRGILKNKDVVNFDKLRKFFSVKEELPKVEEPKVESKSESAPPVTRRRRRSKSGESKS